MNDLEILHGPFDLQTHAENFICYLEVIIRKDGTIEYAVPSHQKKLESIARAAYGIYFEMMLATVQGDYLQWLVDTTGCISVWNNFCVKPPECTPAQMESLKRLGETFYTHGSHLKLYQGEI